MSQSPKGNRPQPAKLFCHSPITTCLGRPPACLRASQPGGATRRRPTPAEDFRYDSPDAKPQLSPRLHDNTSKLQACTLGWHLPGRSDQSVRSVPHTRVRVSRAARAPQAPRTRTSTGHRRTSTQDQRSCTNVLLRLCLHCTGYLHRLGTST